MKIVNDWSEFRYEYLDRLKDCNGQYSIRILVKHQENESMRDVKSHIEKYLKDEGFDKYETLRFSGVWGLEGFGPYVYGTTYNCIINKFDDAKELIEKLQAIVE